MKTSPIDGRRPLGSVLLLGGVVGPGGKLKLAGRFAKRGKKPAKNAACWVAILCSTVQGPVDLPRGSPKNDDATELVRLDEKIAENDARPSPNAKWRAAHAVYEKAELIERLDGDDAALVLYGEVVQRLEGRREPGPRELLMRAMNDIAAIHHSHGRDVQSRSAFEVLVKEHFDDAPPGAREVAVNAALLLARLLNDAGEHAQALELLERLIARYGQPGSPDYRRTATVANAGASWVLGCAGREDEGIRRYDLVIEGLDDTTDPQLRRTLAGALVRKAYLLSEKNLPADCAAICKTVVERFNGAEDPEIAEHVAWAQLMLDEYSKDSRRRRLGRRR